MAGMATLTRRAQFLLRPVNVSVSCHSFVFRRVQNFLRCDGQRGADTHHGNDTNDR